MTVSDRAAAIWIGVIAAAIYVAAGIGLSTDYDYYGRLAAAIRPIHIAAARSDTVMRHQHANLADLCPHG